MKNFAWADAGATVQEAGVEVENHAMSFAMDYQELTSFMEVFEKFTAPAS